MRATSLATLTLSSLLLVAGCAGSEVATGSASSKGAAVATPGTTTVAPDDGAPADGGQTSLEGAVDVVRVWLEALDAGDTSTAESVLGRWSRQSLERTAGLEGIATGLSEGMAAFGRDGVTFDAVGLPETDAVVVTASGDVTREGMTEFGAHAWLVHPEDGRLVVETFSPHVDQVAPRPGSPVSVGEHVEVLLPAGALHAVVDGDLAPQAVDVTDEGEQQRARVMPESGWKSGRSVTTVVTVPDQPEAEGPWAALAVPVRTR